MSSPSARLRFSIIVPCLNERRTIIGLLQAIRAQTTGTEDLEVLIVDGGSTDGTRQRVLDFKAKYSDLRLQLIDNPDGTIPAALNLGLKAARGQMIVRLDAHAQPASDYLAQISRVSQESPAANIGGVWDIRPGGSGWIANSIAVAGSHPLGAGGARYRTSGDAGPVDTVPFGAFDRGWLQQVGPFNESMLTNEDYEMNARIRQAGGVVWFDPSIRSVYYARSNLGELLRQYSRYGYWKAKMIRLFPNTILARQVIPPAFVGLTIVLMGGSLLSRSLGLVLLAQWSIYGTTLLIAGIVESLRRSSPSLAVTLPLTLAIMHLSWGLSFLVGLLPTTTPQTSANHQRSTQEDSELRHESDR